MFSFPNILLICGSTFIFPRWWSFMNLSTSSSFIQCHSHTKCPTFTHRCKLLWYLLIRLLLQRKQIPLIAATVVCSAPFTEQIHTFYHSKWKLTLCSIKPYILFRGMKISVCHIRLRAMFAFAGLIKIICSNSVWLIYNAANILNYSGKETSSGKPIIV